MWKHIICCEKYLSFFESQFRPTFHVRVVTHGEAPRLFGDEVIKCRRLDRPMGAAPFLIIQTAVRPGFAEKGDYRA